MQKRDERNCYSARNSDEEQRVNSTTGFVENIDNPTDIYYKRDSIMHSRPVVNGPGLFSL